MLSRIEDGKMKKFIFIIMCFPFIGCTDYFLGYFDEYYDRDEKPHQQQALLFIEGYVDYNIMPGVPSHEELDTKVYWIHDYCVNSDGVEITGWIFQNECITGNYYGGNWIVVAQNNESVANTSMTHESLHRIRVAMGLSPDNGHTDDLWWDEVQHIEHELRLRGW